MSDRISSFPPVVSNNSKVLILGSVPGVKSLEMQQYYAHPQNHFWKILFQLFNGEFTTIYQDRIDFILKNKLALWDVIDTCERKGSLDSNIINEEANDVRKLLADYPNIKAIICNGQKSYKNLQKVLGKQTEISIFVMPSTSPLHTISLEKKMQEWQMIKTLL